MYAGTDSYDIDTEYSPSLCSKRFQDAAKPDIFVMENFCRFIETETQRAKQTYKVREDVRYGGDQDGQLVDIYYKHEEQSTPIFVFIHGGYWQLLDKNQCGSIVGPLAERGYRVIIANYNLCPGVTLEQLTQQMANFFQWLFKYADETHASAIHLSGHSCGAHLLGYLLSPAYLTLQGAKRIKSLYFISGVYDLRELWSLECVNKNNIFSLNAEKAAELSPMLFDYSTELVEFYNANKVHLHVLVAENDSATFINQTLAYAKQLKAAGFMNVTTKVLEKYDHFDIIEEMTCEGSAITSYICQHLK